MISVTMVGGTRRKELLQQLINEIIHVRLTRRELLALNPGSMNRVYPADNHHLLLLRL
jgi:hypothetical protein